MRFLLRDGYGYRVPREGTASRKVYDMMRAGIAPVEIARALKKSQSTIGVLLYKIRNPDKANARELDYLKRNPRPRRQATREQRAEWAYRRKLRDCEVEAPKQEAIER